MSLLLTYLSGVNLPRHHSFHLGKAPTLFYIYVHNTHTCIKVHKLTNPTLRSKLSVSYFQHYVSKCITINSLTVRRFFSLDKIDIYNYIINKLFEEHFTFGFFILFFFSGRLIKDHIVTW